MSGRPVFMLKTVVSVTTMGVMLISCGTAFDRQYVDFSNGFGTSAKPTQPAQTSTVPAFTGIEAEVANKNVIVVKQGDTLPSVANRAGVSVDALANANGLTASSLVSPGQILRLPAAVTPTKDLEASSVQLSEESQSNIRAETLEPAKTGEVQSGGTHTVTPGETAYSISRLYGVSVSDLAAANGLNSNFSIGTGQVLTIPSTGSVSSNPTQSTANNSTASSGSRFSKPVSGSIASGYTPTSDGVTFATSAGANVQAAGSGEVALVSESTGDQGTIVLVRHSDGLITVYGRMGQVNVSRGQSVSSGQSIGSTAGESLLFQVRRGTESLNPEDYF